MRHSPGTGLRMCRGEWIRTFLPSSSSFWASDISPILPSAPSRTDEGFRVDVWACNVGIEAIYSSVVFQHGFQSDARWKTFHERKKPAASPPDNPCAEFFPFFSPSDFQIPLTNFSFFFLFLFGSSGEHSPRGHTDLGWLIWSSAFQVFRSSSLPLFPRFRSFFKLNKPALEIDPPPVLAALGIAGACRVFRDPPACAPAGRVFWNCLATGSHCPAYSDRTGAERRFGTELYRAFSSSRASSASCRSFFDMVDVPRISYKIIPFSIIFFFFG